MRNRRSAERHRRRRRLQVKAEIHVRRHASKLTTRSDGVHSTKVKAKDHGASAAKRTDQNS